MKEIFRSIAILVALVVAGNLIMLIPDYAGGAWTSFGDTGSVFNVMLCLIPIVVMILLDLDIIDVYSLPFSDLLDHCMNYVLYLVVFISSIFLSGFGSSFNNALSFISTMFVLIFPLYLFYDDIVRVKLRVKNRFINRYLFAAVMGGIILLSVGFSYLLAPTGVYLPGDLYLSMGETSIMDDLFTIPTLYLVSLVGVAAYLVYYLINVFILRLKPKTEYKYATYTSPEPTNNNSSGSERRGAPVKCCKYCRYFTVDMLGYRGCYCKLSGADASEYQSCDYFQD